MTLIYPGDCTLQCGMWLSMTVNSPSGSTLQCDIEFAQTSAILEFYTWFRFRPHHRSRHVILHQSPKFYPNRITFGRKKWRHVNFKDGRSQPSWILGIQQWVLWKAQLHNFLVVNRDHSSKLFIFLKKSRFLHFGDRQTDRQTNKQTNKLTDEQMDSIDALSRSRCRERRLKNESEVHDSSNLKWAQHVLDFRDPTMGSLKSSIT